MISLDESIARGKDMSCHVDNVLTHLSDLFDLFHLMIQKAIELRDSENGNTDSANPDKAEVEHSAAPCHSDVKMVHSASSSSSSSSESDSSPSSTEPTKKKPIVFYPPPTKPITLTLITQDLFTFTSQFGSSILRCFPLTMSRTTSDDFFAIQYQHSAQEKQQQHNEQQQMERKSKMGLGDDDEYVTFLKDRKGVMEVTAKAVKGLHGIVRHLAVLGVEWAEFCAVSSTNASVPSTYSSSKLKDKGKDKDSGKEKVEGERKMDSASVSSSSSHEKDIRAQTEHESTVPSFSVSSSSSSTALESKDLPPLPKQQQQQQQKETQQSILQTPSLSSSSLSRSPSPSLQEQQQFKDFSGSKLSSPEPVSKPKFTPQNPPTSSFHPSEWCLRIIDALELIASTSVGPLGLNGLSEFEFQRLMMAVSTCFQNIIGRIPLGRMASISKATSAGLKVGENEGSRVVGGNNDNSETEISERERGGADSGRGKRGNRSSRSSLLAAAGTGGLSRTITGERFNTDSGSGSISGDRTESMAKRLKNVLDMIEMSRSKLEISQRLVGQVLEGESNEDKFGLFSGRTGCCICVFLGVRVMSIFF
jgi:hypothetical protein